MNYLFVMALTNFIEQEQRTVSIRLNEIELIEDKLRRENLT